MTPLRQFKGVPQEVIRKAEGKQFVRLPTKVLPRDTDTSVRPSSPGTDIST